SSTSDGTSIGSFPVEELHPRSSRSGSSRNKSKCLITSSRACIRIRGGKREFSDRVVARRKSHDFRYGLEQNSGEASRTCIRIRSGKHKFSDRATLPDGSLTTSATVLNRTLP